MNGHDRGRLAGKVAVVAGGASGIGAASVRRLVAEGARVGIGDIDEIGARRLVDELGDDVIAVRYDAEDVSSVERLITATVDRFGRLDVLHNNAALLAPEHFARDTDAVNIDFEVWDRTFAVNVRGYLAGCKYAIPHMISGGGGSIINTASTAGMRGDVANFAYGCSKAAILNMTRSVATVYGSSGVRCNAINPGPVRTPASEANAAANSDRSRLLARHLVLGQYGRPEDIAAAVAWLASDDASFVTGATIDVDGGMLCHAPYTADFLDASRPPS